MHIGLIGSPALTWRRFGVLLSNLPKGSVFVAKLAVRVAKEAPKGEPDPFQSIDDWDLSDQLLAHVVDQLAIANWQRGAGKGGKPHLLTAGPTKSGKVDSRVDARAILAKIGPRREQELQDPSE